MQKDSAYLLQDGSLLGPKLITMVHPSTQETSRGQGLGTKNEGRRNNYCSKPFEEKDPFSRQKWSLGAQV